MKKDLFDYIIVPTQHEYRKENIIDTIYSIPHLIIPSNSFLLHPQDYLINGAIINYNNEVVVSKLFYASMVKYQKYHKKYGDEYYDFWARKYGEQTIKELYSIYDKSLHIINYLYDLKVKPDIHFKNNVRNQLKLKDEKFYEKMNSVYSRLYYNSNLNSVRNDITHNFSDMFYRYKPKYDNNKPTGWYVEEPVSFNEYKNVIDDICVVLSENKNLIIEKIYEIYPPEGSKELHEKVIKEVNELLGCDVDV